MTHVLIVEDHEENRNLLKMLLEANGSRVTAAGDGLEALADARRDPPDAIVSDVLMPKLDGFALCRAWMQDARLKDIPFIFYSATNVRPDDEQFGAALGAVRYLIKPLEAKVFLEELRAVLRQWTGQSAPAAASPLDEVTFHVLHESALARKVEDKVAQLEAANRKLQQSEEKYRRIYDNLQDVYVEATLEGTVLEVSPQIETLSGGQYKREDFIGKSLKAFYADPQRREAILLAIQQQGRANDMESTFRNRDGSLVSCSVSATIVRGADGELRTVSTMRDITERKRAEEVLRESRKLLQLVVEHVPARIFWKDLDLRYLGCNTLFAKDAGHSRPDELIGKTDFEMGWKHQAELYRGDDKAVLESGAPKLDIEEPQTTPDGNTIWLRTSKVPLRDKDNRIIGVLGLYQDVTERKRAAESLRTSEREQRQLAEQLEIERSRLVAAQLVAKIGSWETDLTTMSVIWSDETHRIYETDPAIFCPTHQGFLKLIHPEDRKRVDEAFGRSLDQRRGLCDRAPVAHARWPDQVRGRALAGVF